MSVYYFDTSALVKRYLTELGSAWVTGLADPASGHKIITAEVTHVEAAAAIAAKHRPPKGITRQERDAAVSLLFRHCLVEYRLIPLASPLISRAIDLTQNYRLRGYDAVQLASVLVANDTLLVSGYPGLTFVAADSDLLQAATAENLPTDNPNLHP